MGGLMSFLRILGEIALFFLKKKAKKKTPEEEYEADKKKFNEHLANGDGLGLSSDFERMRDKIRSGDSDYPGGPGDKKPPEREL